MDFFDRVSNFIFFYFYIGVLVICFQYSFCAFFMDTFLPHTSPGEPSRIQTKMSIRKNVMSMLQKQKNENPLCHKSYAYFVLYIYMDMVINHLIGGQDNRHHQTYQPQQPWVVIPTPTAKTTAASEILQMKSMMFQEISRSVCPLCWWTEYCRKIGTIHYELTSVRNSVGDKLR